MPEGFEIQPASSYVRTIEKYAARIRNPRTAIRAKCIECSGGSIAEVKNCRVTGCALYQFREGQNPFHSKTRARLIAEGKLAPDDDEEDDNLDEEIHNDTGEDGTE